MDMNKLLGRNRWDRNRGLQHSSFSEVLQRASAILKNKKTIQKPEDDEYEDDEDEDENLKQS